MRSTRSRLCPIIDSDMRHGCAHLMDMMRVGSLGHSGACPLDGTEMLGGVSVTSALARSSSMMSAPVLLNTMYLGDNVTISVRLLLDCALATQSCGRWTVNHNRSDTHLVARAGNLDDAVGAERRDWDGIRPCLAVCVHH